MFISSLRAIIPSLLSAAMNATRKFFQLGTFIIHLTDMENELQKQFFLRTKPFKFSKSSSIRIVGFIITFNQYENNFSHF